jgi:phosphoenolpyruvate carboxykinase (ATP)
VRDANTETNIWWDNNKAMTPDHFEALHQGDFLAHAKGKRSCSCRTCRRR